MAAKRTVPVPAGPSAGPPEERRAGAVAVPVAAVVPANAPHLALHGEVAGALRDRIFSGALPPGSFVDEPALCAAMGISRTPLREALRVLVAEGLLRHEPRRGCFVNQVTEADLDDIFPVIALLEGRCAWEAARNATDAEIAALETLHLRLAQQARGGRIADYYATNLLIHEAIIALANNRWLAQAIADLRRILKLARLQQLHAPGRLQQSLSEHQAVFAALKARDSEGAEAAMRTHLTRQREALRDIARQQQSRVAL
jgi:DNA-binding GntR family transcriptional regulator